MSLASTSERRSSSVAPRISSGRSCSTAVAPRNPRRRNGRGADMVQNLANHLRLMLVTDDLLLGERDPVAVCQAAERGGVTAVQLRLKQATPRALLDVARRLRAALRVPVILNDRPDVARAAGCWVHLGPDDVSVSCVRSLFTPGEVIGASVGSIGEVGRGKEADYWGVGPLNGSASKLDAGPSLGIAGFRHIVAQAGGRPCIA